ncbi:MAG TPA: PAS domain-containing protein, partial [bacterium]
MKSFHKYSPIPTYIWQVQDKEFILLNYNDAAKQITSGKIANFLGSKASDMYGDMPDILQDFERCSEEKSSFQRDMYYHFKTTGDDKYLSVKYAYVPPDFILVHTEDITERKKIEEGLAKINRCLLSLGTDINENINHLVTLCGELMGAACALYNKLDKG